MTLVLASAGSVGTSAGAVTKGEFPLIVPGVVVAGMSASRSEWTGPSFKGWEV